MPRRSGIDDVRFVPISALEGDMVVDRGERLALVRRPDAAADSRNGRSAVGRSSAAPFRFPVQIRRSSDGEPMPRGYMGRIESGSIAVGDASRRCPRASATTDARHPRLTTDRSPRAGLHAAVTLFLDDELDVSRGDMLVRARRRAGRRARGRLRRCAGSAMRRSTRVARICCAIRRARCAPASTRIDDLLEHLDAGSMSRRRATLARNDIGRVALTLAQPVFAERYDGEPRHRKLHPDRRVDQQHRRGGMVQ